MGEKGVTVIDVIAVLAVVVALVFIATREFPRYDRPALVPPTAAG